MMRSMKYVEPLGAFHIEPYDQRFFSLWEGETLVCVTVYKAGALEVMNRLYSLSGKETHEEEASS